MKITEVLKQQVIETPHNVDVRKLYDRDSAQAMHITLKPGESLKPHVTPVDVFFYILQGTVDVMVGKETLAVQADNLVESPKGIAHSLSNNSEYQARILVLKAPKPTNQSKML